MFISPPPAGNQSCLTVPLSGWSYDTCQVKKVNPLGVPWWCHSKMASTWHPLYYTYKKYKRSRSGYWLYSMCHSSPSPQAGGIQSCLTVPLSGGSYDTCQVKKVNPLGVPWWCHSKMAPTWHPLYYTYKKYERSRSGYWLYSTYVI